MAVKFEIIGSEELQKSLRELGRRAPRAAMTGLKITALEILNDAKERLASGGHRVTSKLFNSGRVNELNDEQSFEVAFGGIDGELMYAYYVEFGRRAGKMPPIDYIKEWARKKQLADTWSISSRKRNARGADYEMRLNQTAFLIARSIAKKGTKAHPFLFPAFEAKRDNVIKNVTHAVNALIKQITK